MITNYNHQLVPFSIYAREKAVAKPNEQAVATYLSAHPDVASEDHIKWSRSSLRTHLSKQVQVEFADDDVFIGGYRPFQRMFGYYNRYLNHERSQLPSMFPTPAHTNIGIVLTGPASHFVFTPLITDLLPNLHLLDTAQYFPRWTYMSPDADGTLALETEGEEPDEYGYRRIDNITDEILAVYQNAVSDQVTKDEIFYYVYGLLHDPVYRETYAADLKKMLPRIPTPDSQVRFEQLSAAGRSLSDLHVGYESVEPYPVDVQFKPGANPKNRET